MKIIGNTVGTPLPKPDFKQTDPNKGDYIKNKPEVVDAAVGQLLAIKTIDEDGHIAEFESVEVSTDDVLADAKDYTDGKITDWVGDHTVPEQVSAALTTAQSYTDTKITQLIDGAPTTLDTLNEIATAMNENADVIEALDAAIGSKATVQFITWEADD